MTDFDFIALYDLLSPRMLRFFARATLDPQVAADLTAETFVTLYAQRTRFDSTRGTPEAWANGVGRHLLQRYLRDRRIERSARDRFGLTVQTLSEADHERVEALIDFKDMGDRVGAALDVLTHEQREAVSLRVIEGLDYQEVAGRIGCSEQTARARVSRGLRELGIHLASATTKEAQHGH